MTIQDKDLETLRDSIQAAHVVKLALVSKHIEVTPVIAQGMIWLSVESAERHGVNLEELIGVISLIYKEIAAARRLGSPSIY